MKKLSHPPLSPSRLVIALSLAQISFLNPLLAAEANEREDTHHDKALRVAMSRHDITREHFLVPEGKTVPIYCIQKHIKDRARAIHTEQLLKSRTALVTSTPTSSPIKATQSSPSILGTIAAIPGHILYSPVYLYNILPSWPSRSAQDASSVASASAIVKTGASPSAGLDVGFVEVNNQDKAKSTPQSAVVLTPLNALTVTPVLDPVISILTNDGEQQGSSPKAASSSLPSTLIHPGEGESSPSLSHAVLTTYAEGGGDSGTKGTSSSRRYTLIYSGDGGGVKGLITAILVAYQEKQTNTPMSDLYDHVIGTSISGVQVLGWTTNNIDGKPAMSGAGAVDLMEHDTASIFPNEYRWYITSKILGGLSSLRYAQFDPGPFETRLKAILGTTTTFANARTHVYVPVLISETNQPLVISNRTHPNVLSWEGARGTSAAPTKFPAFQAMSLPNNPYVLDGGLSLNNPADYILDEATAYESSIGNRDTEMVLFSAGTGRQPINPIPVDAGLLNGTGPIVEAFTESQVLGTHLTLMRRMKLGETYFRADPTLPYHIPLDTLTDDSIKTLRAAAETQYDIVDKFLETDAVRLRLEAK